MWLAMHTEDTFSHTKHTHWAKPVTRNPVATACGATSPCFQGFIEDTPRWVRGTDHTWEDLSTVVLFPRTDLPRAIQTVSCFIVIQFRTFKNVETVAPAVIGHTIIYKWNRAAAGHLGLTVFSLEQSRGWTSTGDDFSPEKFSCATLQI